MRAVVLGDAPPALEVADVVDPVPAADEVVLAVTACGICGSDLHVASAIGAPGTILGHEIAGTVAALGSGVDPGAWRIGQPVVARPLAGCGTCRYCVAGRPDHCAHFQLLGLNRPGGFAELMSVQARELYALPTGLVGPEQALVEPLAIARRALRRSGLVAGETVGVIGAGPIGLAVITWARALGAGTIVVSDPAPDRRELGLAMGADLAVDPLAGDLGEAALAATGDLPQTVIECSGRPEQIGRAMDQVAIDGRVTVVSVCITDASIFPYTGLSKELDIRFSLYYGVEDYVDTLAALEAGSLTIAGLLTETVSLDDLPDRFHRLIHEPTGGKVAVLP